jgi:CHAT domain/Tetratricopeptide repeat
MGDRKGEAKALSGLANVYASLGHKQLALENLNEALVIQRSDNDLGGQGETLNSIGDLYSDMGQTEKARQYYDQASKFPAPRPLPSPKLIPPPSVSASAASPPPVATSAATQLAEADSAASADGAAEASSQSQAVDAQPMPAAAPPPSPKSSGQHGKSGLAGHNLPSTFGAVPTTASPVSASATSPQPIERYPNIEAPDRVTAGQEIAVQVSLTSEQISTETKILSGTQHEGKLQLQMAEGENQWTLTVNVTAPGMELTRGGSNTAVIAIARDGDSSIALFYLRAQPLDPANAEGKRDTRILATLWHNTAFLARISRPLTIVANPTATPVNRPSPQSEASAPHPAVRTMLASAPSPAIDLSSNLVAPDLTIIENRIGNVLRLTFYSAKSGLVEADIPNPDDLHSWINTHYAQMASHSRGLTPEPATPAQSKTELLHSSDYLYAFGGELYDRFAPQAFKDLFFQIWPTGPQGRFPSIQIFSDDPSLPWELMRPALQSGSGRLDFLGDSFSIARWPLSRRGMTRPTQSFAMEQSVVIAPGYRGTQQLAAANRELAALKSFRGFTEINGNYAAVRQLAAHPPQGIIHFAGHGEVKDQNGVPQFAILLEDSEMDPATWQALGNGATATHPLFFFNACDVGESRQFMNDVDGWAPALLGNGASGYIGALWPVKDTTAELFATTFYAALGKSIASGTNLNVASLLARTRAQVFLKTGDATALAYVFYGDPRLVLTAQAVSQ